MARIEVVKIALAYAPTNLASLIAEAVDMVQEGEPAPGVKEFHSGEQPAHASGWHRGAGLGLPISKRLVELHHGQMGVESVYLKGASFCLPCPSPRPAAWSMCGGGHCPLCARALWCGWRAGDGGLLSRPGAGAGRVPRLLPLRGCMDA